MIFQQVYSLALVAYSQASCIVDMQSHNAHALIAWYKFIWEAKTGISPLFFSQKIAQKAPEKKIPSTAEKDTNLSENNTDWLHHLSAQQAFFCTDGIVSTACNIDASSFFDPLCRWQSATSRFHCEYLPLQFGIHKKVSPLHFVLQCKSCWLGCHWQYHLMQRRTPALMRWNAFHFLSDSPIVQHLEPNQSLWLEVLHLEVLKRKKGGINTC